jgi:hypothetical protein
VREVRALDIDTRGERRDVTSTGEGEPLPIVCSIPRSTTYQGASLRSIAVLSSALDSVVGHGSPALSPPSGSS